MPNTDGKKYDFVVDIKNIRTTYGLAYSEVRENSSVLDIGCATGNLIQKLKDLKHCKVKGVDLDPDAIRIAKENGLDAEILDIEREESLRKITGKYDTVLLLDVIEHLKYPPTVLLEKIRSLLRDSGRLIISIPNLNHIDVVTRMLSGTLEYQSKGILDSTHTHFYTPKELKSLLRCYGLVFSSMTRIFVQPGKTELATDTPDFKKASKLIEKNYTSDEATTYQYFLVFTKRNDKTINDAPATTDGIIVNSPTPITVTNQKPWYIITRTQGTRNDLLVETLYSIAMQKYENKNSIVVVHSDDKTVINKIVDLTSKFAPILNIRVLSATCEKKRGHPINVALDTIKSGFVSFLDDDDVYYTSFSSALMPYINKEQYNFVYGKSTCAFQEKKRTYYKTISKRGIYGEKFNPVKFVTDNRIPFNTYIFQAEAFQGIRFSEELDLLEDWDFLLQLMESGKMEPHFVPVPISEYRIRNNSTNSSLSEYGFQYTQTIPLNLLIAREIIANRFLTKKFNFSFRDAFAIYPDVNQIIRKDPNKSEVGKLTSDCSRMWNELERIKSRKAFKILDKTFRMIKKPLY